MAVVQQECSPNFSSLGSNPLMDGAVELPKLMCNAANSISAGSRSRENITCNKSSPGMSNSAQSVACCTSMCVDNLSLRMAISPHSDPKLYNAKSRISASALIHTPLDDGRTLLRQQSSSEDGKTLNAHTLIVHAPTCRRSLIADFEKNMTFRPKLNEYSLKIVSKTARNSVPVVHRLLEGRKSLHSPYEQNLTFQPKLNTLSVKLAQERATRMPEVQARMTEVAVARTAEAMSQYTFKPHVSQRSLRIAQNLGTDFLVRQKIHQERKQKVQDQQQVTRSPGELPHRRRLIQLTPRVPPITSSRLESNTLKSEESCCSSESASSVLTRSNSSLVAKPPTLSKPTRISPRSATYSRRVHYTSTQPSSNSDNATKTLPLKHRLWRSNSSPQTTKKATKTKGHLHSRSGSSPAKSGSPQSCRLEGAKFKTLSDGDRVKRIRMKVEKVTKERKVFLVHGGYRTIRRCLRRRGWVQLDYNQLKQTISRGSPLKHFPSKHPGSPTFKRSHAHRKLGAGAGSRRGSKDSGRGLSLDSSDDDSDVDILSQSDGENSDEEEYCMLSRGLRNCPPNFVWTLRRDMDLYSSLRKDTILNHFLRASTFTTKVGLCKNLRNLLWSGDVDPNTLFPRCYRLSCGEEKDAFIDDYRFTAALSILKMLPNQYAPNAQPTHSVKTSQNTHPDIQLVARPSPTRTRRASATASSRPRSATNPDGQAVTRHSPTRPRPGSNTIPRPSSSSRTRPASATRPPSSSSSSNRVASPQPSLPRPVLSDEVVLLAVKACENFLGSKEHNDIEVSHLQLCPKLSEEEWQTLVDSFYCMAYDGALVACSCYQVSRTKEVLAEVEPHFPQVHMDGKRNIWIVKPGALSRGRGIMCMDRLEDILELVAGTVQKNEGKWVVQKYIERPLLIYDTKFDIRQWFLVTDWNPLTMWMYKDCYLRFSTQLYTLDNLDESVHLCNNSIQKYYENTSTRSQALPATNMWDGHTFQKYLSGRGEGDSWDSVVYPGMKQALVHVLQVTQDEIEQRKNAFELYGADFILSEDLTPWLIEINCSPAMEASTEITKRLCRQVMEDTIKVVVDRREDKDCDIGRFELAFKQPRTEVPPYVGMQLCVTGSAIHRPRDSSYQRNPVSVPSAHHTTTTLKLSGVRASLSTGISYIAVPH